MNGLRHSEFIVIARGHSAREAFLSMRHRMRGHETYVMAWHFVVEMEEARLRAARMMRDSDTWKITLEDAVGCIPIKRTDRHRDIDTKMRRNDPRHATRGTLQRFLFFGIGPSPAEQTAGDDLAELIEAHA